MSTAATKQPEASSSHGSHGELAGHGEHAHPPHLAHHFDTMGQQFDAGKLGMWVFLATEILMFGGLFCAYAVYRANNPDVFAFAHKELNTTLGAINTVVLIASSLTMAWAVRCSQLGQKRGLVLCLTLSLMGGFGFLAIKTIEYHKKYDHQLWIGSGNEYHPKFTGEKHSEAHGQEKGHAPAKDAQKNHDDKGAAEENGAAHTAPESTPESAAKQASTAPEIDRSSVKVPSAGPEGVSSGVLTGTALAHEKKHAVHYEDLAKFDEARVHIFFQIYYMMTGLHGLHVLIGMSLMFWILLRAVRPAARKWVFMLGPAAICAFVGYVGAIIGNWLMIYTGLGLAVVLAALSIFLYDRARRGPREGTGEFGPHYFIPVDLVGLYWHLVDLIWIFLFPLLYLIH